MLWETPTQLLWKKWRVSCLLPQQSSLDQLKYLPDANAAHSAHATLTGKCHIFVHRASNPYAQNITTNNLCAVIVNVCAFYKYQTRVVYINVILIHQCVLLSNSIPYYIRWWANVLESEINMKKPKTIIYILSSAAKPGTHFLENNKIIWVFTMLKLCVSKERNM